MLKYAATLIPLLLMLSFSTIHAQQISFEEAIEQAERNPALAHEARATALERNEPISIYSEQQSFMAEPVGLTEDGVPVYSVIRNFINMYDNGTLQTLAEIEQEYDLSAAYMNFGQGSGRTFDITSGAGLMSDGPLVLVSESSESSVIAFDLETGDIVNQEFIPESPETMSTPIHPLQSPGNTITITDQTESIVHEYNTQGDYIGVFAPAGGQDFSVMQNVRGHYYRDNGNMLVTVFAGANAGTLVEIDTEGEFVGVFGETDVAALNGPWSIFEDDGRLFVVNSSGTTGILEFDPDDGSYEGLFSSGWGSFPQQMTRTEDGFASTQFSGGAGNSGIVLLDEEGEFQELLSAVPSARGLMKLGNGNFLVSSGAGIFEVDPETDSVVRTLVEGVSARHMSIFMPEDTDDPGELIVEPGELNFGEVSIGFESTLILQLSNAGDSGIEVSDVVSDSDVFTTNFTEPITLSGGQSAEIEVTFSPDAAGEFSGLITVFSDDPENPEQTVDLSGEGVAFSIIAVDPDEFELELEQGETTEETFTITNNGEGVLDFTLPRFEMERILDGNNLDFEAIRSAMTYRLQSAEDEEELDRRTQDRRMFHMYENGLFTSPDARQMAVIERFRNKAALTSTASAGLHQTDDVMFEFEALSLDGGEFMTVGEDFAGELSGVAADFVLDDTDDGTWASDLALLITTENPEDSDEIDASSVVLQVGGFTDFGSTPRINWETGNSNEPGTEVITTIEIPTPLVMENLFVAIGNGWPSSDGGTWTGSITLLGVTDSTPFVVSAEPASGSVDPGDSMEVTFIADTEGLDAGDYFDFIRIASNDPETPLLDVDVFLTVTEAEPDSENVTFQVDMSAQQDAGIFQPETGDLVYLRSEFNDWSTVDGEEMELEDAGVYTITYELEGEAGTTFEYKYYIQAGDGRDLPNGGWESDDVGENGTNNRIVELAGEDQTLPVVFFNNMPVNLGPDTENPTEFALNQNYPNPFNPTTVIEYALPENADVTLEVFNLQGQRVATLVNSQKQAGRYSVTFDAGSLASGLYIYRIQAGTFTETQKMMLVK